MVQIIPTLFSTSEEEYRIRLSRLSSSSFPEDGWVQLDLMDNKFVPKLGISLDVVTKYPNPYHKEAQLMVLDPEEWIDGLLELKVDRIIFPIEIDKNILNYIKRIKQNSTEVGLSLNPETNPEKLSQYIDDLDAVLLMGVNPGSEEQQLDPHIPEKIRYIKDRGWGVKIGIDGGVNDTNIKSLVDLRVDYLAIGSYLFTGDFDENLEKLWEVING